MRVKKETGFTRRLRELMKENKKSCRVLGDFLGRSYASVHNYAVGRDEPSIETLIEIANYFNVSVGYLLGVEDDR